MAVTWIISILMSCMVFMMGKSYKYNDYVTLCTWSLDDLGLGTVEKDWRSVAYFFLVVLPIFLPVTFTFICLAILIVFFSRNSKTRTRVRVSLADMVEVSDGFAQAMKNMLDAREKLKRSFSNPQKLQSETLKKTKSDGVVYRTMQRLKSRKFVFKFADECAVNEEPICNETVSATTPDYISVTNQQQDHIPTEKECNENFSQRNNDQAQRVNMIPISCNPVSEIKDETKPHDPEPQ